MKKTYDRVNTPPAVKRARKEPPPAPVATKKHHPPSPDKTVEVRAVKARLQRLTMSAELAKGIGDRRYCTFWFKFNLLFKLFF